MHVTVVDKREETLGFSCHHGRRGTLLHLVTTREFLSEPSITRGITDKVITRIQRQKETTRHRALYQNRHKPTPNSITHTVNIQIPPLGTWSTLDFTQQLSDTEGDIGDQYPTGISTPPDDSDSSRNSTDFSSASTPSSRFTFSPATWTPQETGSVTPQIPYQTSSVELTVDLSDDDMTETAPAFFTGKPEDQDPQDFMNKIERTILMKSGLSEADKVRFFELSIKTKSPAETWLLTLTSADKASFKAVRLAFEVRWPAKLVTVKTTAEKQALLDETVLKLSDLGKRVAASLGAEEELSHVVWADKVERLAKDIPDTNNLLVASTRKKLPKPLLKLVGLKPMTWGQFADAVREISLEEIMEKIEEERDAVARYAPVAPNTPSKALGAAFQNINLAQQPQSHRTQLTPRVTFNTYSERPAHERLADVLSKALPLQPNNPEGLVTYNNQVAAWQTTHGQSGKGPTETRPYPLTPGTVPVASGECWKCGHRAHHPAACPAPPVPTLETKWRSIAQTIRKKAEIAATAAVNINLVNVESDEVNTYEAEDLAHLQQLIQQGKAGGSST